MKNITHLFSKFKDNNILIVGDVMVDTYLIGNVERISPEAPVPIVDINEKIDKLGGAANVALNIKELGANPIICSIIGKDNIGDKILELMDEQNISTKYIDKTEKRKTTNKIRVIGNKAQMLRIDNESKDDLDALSYISLTNKITLAIFENKIDAIIIQDYNKGVINAELFYFINKLNQERKIPIFVDPKIKNFEDYKNIKIFKPNFNELKKGMKLYDLDINKFQEIESVIEKLIYKQNMEIVYTTLGDKGIYVSYFSKNDNIVHTHIQGEKRNVADVSGAGDTVISVATLLTINGLDEIKTATISNLAGGLVCEEVGVVPINKEKLINEINEKFSF